MNSGLRLLRSRGWPTLTAIIVSSIYQRAGYGCDIVYVQYEYRVNEELHVGEYARAWVRSGGQEYAKQFPIGNELTIRTKPDNPSISVMLGLAHVNEVAVSSS